MFPIKNTKVKETKMGISIGNHMAVRLIVNISSELFFINFEIIPSVSEQKNWWAVSEIFKGGRTHGHTEKDD